MTRSRKDESEAAKRLAEAQLPLWTDADIARWEAERNAGRAGKETGMARAANKAATWMDHAYWSLLILAATGRPFTSEDVTELAGLPTGTTQQHANNAVGALFNMAAREGVIEKTGRHVQSRVRTSHATEINEWRGK
jgi:hypothetical protein